jgi:hypothetical protein
LQTHFCRNSYWKCHKRRGNFTKNVQCYHISCFVPLSNTVDWFRVLVWEKYLRFNNTSFLHVINPSLHSTQGMSVFNMLLLRYHHREQKSEWESNENNFKFTSACGRKKFMKSLNYISYHLIVHLAVFHVIQCAWEKKHFMLVIHIIFLGTACFMKQRHHSLTNFLNKSSYIVIFLHW